MIRFVRVSHQDECSNDTWFGFYCTVMDDFVTFNETQIFATVEHFKNCYENKNSDDENRPIERFLSLVPDDLGYNVHNVNQYEEPAKIN